MTGLIDLGQEPLMQIISTLSILDLAVLWACGDNQLNFRLSKGNVVQGVAINRRAFWNPNWASLVGHFSHLESFSLSLNPEEVDPIAMGRDLMMLPRNLKNLGLSCRPALSVANALFALKPAHFVSLQSLKLISPHKTPRMEIVLPRTITELELGGCAPLGKSSFYSSYRPHQADIAGRVLKSSRQ
jgi:hypothetical protein